MSLFRQPVSDDDCVAALRRRGQSRSWVVVLSVVFLLLTGGGILWLLLKLDEFFDEKTFLRAQGYYELILGSMFGLSFGIIFSKAVTVVLHAIGLMRVARAERLLVQYYDRAHDDRRPKRVA